MKTPKERQKFCWVAFLLLWSITSCAEMRSVPVNQPLSNEGEIYLFLQPMGEKSVPLKFILEDVSVLREDGVSIPLTLSFQKIIGVDRVHKQSLLARTRVPVGSYKGLSIKVSEAEIMTEDGPIALEIKQDLVWLPKLIEIKSKKAIAFFLTFHPEDSLESHVLFRPIFSVTTASQYPLARLGYISMPFDNNLYIFHDNSMLLTGVVATGLLPRGMVADRDRGRLYAALGESSIAVIDMLQQTNIGNIRLRPGDDPQEIALSHDGRTLLSANYGSNTVSIVDPLSFVELHRVTVGGGPTSVVFSPGGKTAYSMNSLANTISVIDTGKITLSSTINLEESPFKAAFDRFGNELYLITNNSPNMLVIDPKGSATGVQKIFIGIGARSILVDTRTSLVYVGKKDGEIAVVDPTIRAYIDTIQLNGPVESMAISDEENFLFALVPRQQALMKVNLISKEVLGRIDLIGEGYGISLVGAR